MLRRAAGGGQRAAGGETMMRLSSLFKTNKCGGRRNDGLRPIVWAAQLSDRVQIFFLGGFKGFYFFVFGRFHYWSPPFGRKAEIPKFTNHKRRKLFLEFNSTSRGVAIRGLVDWGIGVLMMSWGGADDELGC